MILIDGSYLYSLGQAIQPLRTIINTETYMSVWQKCFYASSHLNGFVTSIYKDAFRIMMEPARSLINALADIHLEATKQEKAYQQLDPILFNNLVIALQEFESVFKAEFRHGNLFLATKKGAYDIRTLIENGESLFPSDFATLFPEALKDVQEGARCLVYEMYTASGFHFHRANESVLLKYLESVGIKKPPNRNMGAYIRALESSGDTKKAPDEVVICLKNLKDLHRNPLMHPGQSIDNVDDALALINAIHTAITAMMKEITKQQGG